MKQSKLHIPASKPSLNKQGRKYLLDAYDTGWISSAGSYIPKFEAAFAKYNGITYGAACSSGTTALQLALRAIDIKPGDEVIVPEFTMIATAWAATYVGAVPVFVDCLDDLNIDTSKIEEKITAKTKAIIPVHVYGRQCNMNEVVRIAKKHNLKIIEDSAEAHGIVPHKATDIACFSLFGNKIITAGEGGICLTNNKTYDTEIKYLRSMAFSEGHTFLHEKLGYNFRMTNMQAAVALAQTEAIDKILEKRRKIENWYTELLQPLNGTVLALMPKRDVLWYYDILVEQAKDRDPLREFLAKQGIETRLFFKPMSQQPMYLSKGYTNLRACDYSLRGLYLPTFTDMSKKEVTLVCDAIKEFFLKYSHGKKG